MVNDFKLKHLEKLNGKLKNLNMKIDQSQRSTLDGRKVMDFYGCLLYLIS